MSISLTEHNVRARKQQSMSNKDGKPLLASSHGGSSSMVSPQPSGAASSALIHLPLPALISLFVVINAVAVASHNYFSGLLLLLFLLNTALYMHVTAKPPPPPVVTYSTLADLPSPGRGKMGKRLSNVSEYATDPEWDSDNSDFTVQPPKSIKPVSSSSSNNLANRRRLIPGESMKKNVAGQTTDNSWTDADAQSFRCRIGPNYATNKQKGPSAEALYDCLGADLYSSNLKVNDFGSKLDLSKLLSAGGSDPRLPIPELFVVNMMFPGYTPSNPVWGKTKEDGESYSMVCYYKLSEATKTMLLKPKTEWSVTLFLVARLCG